MGVARIFFWICLLVTVGWANGQSTHDTCATAVPLEVDGEPIEGTTIGARTPAEVLCEDQDSSSLTYDFLSLGTCRTPESVDSLKEPGVFYSIQGTGTGVQIDLCHSDSYDKDGRPWRKDYAIHVHQIRGTLRCSISQCEAMSTFQYSVDQNDTTTNPEATPMRCGVGPFPRGQSLRFATEKNATYSVRISDWIFNQSSFDISASTIPTAANDVCANPIKVPSDGEFSGTISFAQATRDFVPHHCSYVDSYASQIGGLWYKVEGTGDIMQVAPVRCPERTSPSYRIAVGVYEGFDCHISSEDLECIGQVSSGPSGCSSSGVKWWSQERLEYYIHVGYHLPDFGPVDGILEQEASFTFQVSLGYLSTSVWLSAMLSVAAASALFF